MSKSFLGQTGLTLGIRNNNPGNIKKSSNAWLGKIGNDGVFEKFSNIVMGLRASMTNLRTYQTKHNLTTIKQIITRWAPGSENNTEKYISAVSASTGFNSNEPLDLNDKSTLIRLTQAIVKHECSPNHDLITDQDYFEAYDLLANSGGGSSLNTGSGANSETPSTPTEKKKSLNIFVVGGVLLALLCSYLLFKK